MYKNILIGILTAVLVVAIGTAAYNVIGAQAAGGTNSVSQGFGGGQGRGNGQADGSGVPQAQANLASASTFHGTVSEYSYGTLTVLADDGQSIAVQVGNSNYATSIGFAPQVGDAMTVTALPGDQAGLLSAMSITMDNGQVYTFRDATTGRPMWAGGNGKGGGNY